MRYLLLTFVVLTLRANKINHIKDLKWNNRVLIVITEINKNDFSKEINLFKREFDDRDFIIIYIIGQNTFMNQKKMSEAFSKSVLKKIKNINKDHFLILLGKDGEVKKSYSSKKDLERIFFDVDKMPMRKYEIKMNNKK